MISKSPYENISLFYIEDYKDIRTQVDNVMTLFHESILNDKGHYILPFFVPHPISGYIQAEQRHNIRNIKTNRCDGRTVSSYDLEYFNYESYQTYYELLNILTETFSVFLKEFTDNIETNSSHTVFKGKETSFYEDYLKNDKRALSYNSIKRHVKNYYLDSFLSYTNLSELKIPNKYRYKRRTMIYVKTERVNLTESFKTLNSYLTLISFLNTNPELDSTSENAFSEYLKKIKRLNDDHENEEHTFYALDAFSRNDVLVKDITQKAENENNFLTKLLKLKMRASDIWSQNNEEESVVEINKVLKNIGLDKDILITTVIFVPVIKGTFEPEHITLSKKIAYYEALPIYQYFYLEFMVANNYLRKDIVKSQNRSTLSIKEPILNHFTPNYNKVVSSLKALYSVYNDEGHHITRSYYKDLTYFENKTKFFKTVDLTVVKNTDLSYYLASLFESTVEHLFSWFDKKQTKYTFPEGFNNEESKLNLDFLMSNDLLAILTDTTRDAFYKCEKGKDIHMFYFFLFVVFKLEHPSYNVFLDFIVKKGSNDELFKAALKAFDEESELIASISCKTIVKILRLSIVELKKFFDSLKEEAPTKENVETTNDVIEDVTEQLINDVEVEDF